MGTINATEYEAMVERLRQARQEAGMTQETVAEFFGKPQSFVSKIESGDRRIDPVELCYFADLYKKPLGFFLPEPCSN
ncbi:MAG: helix-turn-helix transcriptional regulator [Acidobacteriota bacterium]